MTLLLSDGFEVSMRNDVKKRNFSVSCHADTDNCLTEAMIKGRVIVKAVMRSKVELFTSDMSEMF